MNRVLIIGPSGAGKSTLAALLGRQLALPVVHLDREYWRPGWQPRDPAEWESTVRRLSAESRWVMDGDFCRTIGPRLQACDTVVFLDLSRWLCLARVMRRSVRDRGRLRPDLSEGCPERLPPWRLLRRIWTYRRRRRPRILQMLQAEPSKCIIHLMTKREVTAFLHHLRARTAAPKASATTGWRTGPANLETAAAGPAPS